MKDQSLGRKNEQQDRKWALKRIMLQTCLFWGLLFISLTLGGIISLTLPPLFQQNSPTRMIHLLVAGFSLILLGEVSLGILKLLIETNLDSLSLLWKVVETSGKASCHDHINGQREKIAYFHSGKDKVLFTKAANHILIMQLQVIYQRRHFVKQSENRN